MEIAWAGVVLVVLVVVVASAPFVRASPSYPVWRRPFRAASMAVWGFALCVIAIALSEQCPGDPRFACGSPDGVIGLGLWGLAVVLLVSAIVVGVNSSKRTGAAAVLIAIWIGVIVLLPESVAEDHETLLVAVVVGIGLACGASLGFWAFALIPLGTLAAVPFGTQGDSDGQSIWVYTAIDSVVILTLPFLVSALIATGIRWRGSRRTEHLA